MREDDRREFSIIIFLKRYFWFYEFNYVVSASQCSFDILVFLRYIRNAPG